MNTPQTLGQAIRRRRCELGLTQEALAERIGHGVRQAEVSRLERDKVTLPRRDRLGRIAAALDLPLGELLARSGWTGAEVAFDPPAVAVAVTAPPATPRVDRVLIELAPRADAQIPTSAAGMTQLRAALAASRAVRLHTAQLLDDARRAYRQALGPADRPPLSYDHEEAR